MTLGGDDQRALAKRLFNAVWDLLDREERSVEEDDIMLHMAHASRHHWGEAGSPVNLVRGEWQCSRVYAVLGRAEPATHHARRCLSLCEQHGIGDFDLAYAYEALARAAAISRSPITASYLGQAYAALAGIVDADDRQLVEADLATIKV
jgi:hypothetical protein